MSAVRLPTTSTAFSALLVSVQGISAAMMALLMLLTRPFERLPLVEASATGIRTELAVALVMGAFVLFMLAFAIASLEDWARFAALFLESLLLAGAAVRFPMHPLSALPGVLIAGAVIVLLLTDSAWGPRSDGEATATGGRPAQAS